VTTTDGRPIPGASIHVSGAAGAAGGEIIKATTDRTGRYRVTVPPGDYAVDGFVDVEHSGRTYRELWLDRVNATCERVTSTQGIARDFVLRLSGAKKCIGNPDAADPASYNGAYVTALSSAFPPDALITVSLTPLGPLADGTTGGILTFARSGAALRSNSGPIDQTAVLHDIPLGRYRVTAEARYADGTRHGVSLQPHDGGERQGTSVDIAFDSNAPEAGIHPLSLGLTPESAVIAAEPRTPSVVATSPPARAPSGKTVPEPTPGYAELPVGRYACSDFSQPVGELATQKAIIILAGGHYQGFGGTGGYVYDAAKESVRWTSGPLAGPDVRVSYGQRNGRPTITVVGSGFVDAPGQKSYCTLMGK
jgi:hypothetical protein